MTHNLINTRQTFRTGSGREGILYSCSRHEPEGIGVVSRLPVSTPIVQESVLRYFDEGRKITGENVRALAKGQAAAERSEEVPFVVARVFLQDFTDVPLLVDL